MTLTETAPATAEGNDKEATPAPVPEPTPAVEEIVTTEVVEDILKSHNADLDLLDFSARLGSQLGDNYMSIMYAVDINAKSRTTGIAEVFHIMLKTLPRNNFRQQMINEMKAFEKESKMYGEVFEDFIAFQKEKGLEDGEMFSAFPKCYSSFCNGTTDYLAMEDLRYSGYKMGNRIAGLDEDHSKLAVMNLAKFHAVSFAMFQGDYNKILEKYPFLEERMFKKPEDLEPMYKAYTQQTFVTEGEALRKAGLVKEAERVEGVYDEDFHCRLRRLAGDEVKWAVIGHGDCWTNNMLFTYDDVTGKPLEHKFLDFQISRASSRTIDLNYFIYSSLPMKDLNTRENSLLRLYHDTFTHFAAKLGYSNEELTFENLLQEMDEFRPYGIIMGLLLAPILSADKDAVPDLETMDFKPDNAADSVELTKEFYAEMMKSDLLTLKLTNIAQNHIPRCKTWNKEQN
ncbi:unnamed protein product [Allacma fusca]|uniref:CHK kinase-like domain-containing protein n=1 Tax=Allacma fusca TaxID=39272 RepID=A0A8J2PVS0_9HEXA|nr:unnamed protein product [Allacma fusca]